jgi:hypothetical protein
LKYNVCFYELKPVWCLFSLMEHSCKGSSDISEIIENHNVTYTPISRQRLNKHVPNLKHWKMGLSERML